MFNTSQSVTAYVRGSILDRGRNYFRHQVYTASVDKVEVTLSSLGTLVCILPRKQSLIFMYYQGYEFMDLYLHSKYVFVALYTSEYL